MLIPLIKGLATYIPSLYRTFSKHRTGGTISARYCYSVWMRHLLNLFDHNKKVVPSVVAELGPGDSLGIGLAALVSGAKRLYSLDIVDFSYEERNLDILYEIVALFKNRARIPDNSEFPLVKPPLVSFEFPKEIFTNDYLDVVLSEKRIEAIKHGILTRKKRRIIPFPPIEFEHKRRGWRHEKIKVKGKPQNRYRELKTGRFIKKPF